MIFFAVAIPVIIGVVGAMMYLERGRTVQYQSYYDHAFDLAVKASKYQDPAQQRAAWGLVLIDLDTADDFRKTADSKALRLEAQQALDQLEHITRIDLQPAIRGGLDKTVQVSRIVATNEELYLLNSTRGNVIRALYTTRGYEVDPNFRCGKGTYGTIVVGAPVGIVPLPKGNLAQADVLGLDENGNLLYCGTTGNLPVSRRVTLPELWKKPTAITLNPDNLNLYVLDIPANQVWIYQNVEKAEELLPFFDEPEPPSLANVIDIAAASGDLFLLRSEGQVSRCTYGSIQEIVTRCVPVTFTGLPGGRPNGTTIEGTQLWQMVYAPPPGPSLYMLDAANQAILHLSLLGNFQSQYRSQNSLPAQPAVALAISPGAACSSPWVARFTIPIYRSMLTIAIQAGGESRRMGIDKALIDFHGQPLIARVLGRVASLVDELLVTANQPEAYTFLKVPCILDLLPGYGALGGLYTALSAAHYPLVAVIACDMPFASADLLAYQQEVLLANDVDVVIPRTIEGLEPFHAIYRKESCLPLVKTALEAGKRRVDAWLDQTNVRYLTPEEIARYDLDGLAFLNVNTPSDLAEALHQDELIR